MMREVIISILRVIINRRERVSDTVSGSACSAISKHSSKSELKIPSEMEVAPRYNC